MCSRISDRCAAAGALLLLAACSGAPPADEAGGVAGKDASPVQAVKNWITGMDNGRDTIPCALREGERLAADCRIEMVTDARGRVLILSTPAGGFRRFRVATDGTLSAADGAEDTRAVSDAVHMLVAVGSERYAVPLNALAPEGAAP